MVRIFSLTFALQACSITFSASTPCKRDACYNAVALQAPGKPNLSSRKADCSAVLKTVIDDDVTVTVTNFQTSTTATVVITSAENTITETRGPDATVTVTPRKRQDHQDIPRQNMRLHDPNVLDERDIIVVSGSSPSYARAACEKTQNYAIACLCFGVKAPVIKAGPARTITITRTVLTDTLTTTFVDATTTIQPTPTATVVGGPRGPSCNQPTSGLGVGGCSSNCYCDPRGNGLGVCDDTFSCTQPCTADGDCPANQACAIGGATNVCGGSTCVSYTACTSTFVPTRRRALYDLLQVFARKDHA